MSGTKMNDDLDLDNEAVGEEEEGLDLGGDVEEEEDPGAEPATEESESFVAALASGAGLEFEDSADGDDIDVSSFLGDLSNLGGEDDDDDDLEPVKKTSGGGAKGSSTGTGKKKQKTIGEGGASSGKGSGSGGRKAEVPRTQELEEFAKKLPGMTKSDAVIALASDYDLTTAQITAYLNGHGVSIVYQSVRSTLISKGLHKSVGGEKLVTDDGVVLKPRAKKGETVEDLKKQVRELLVRIKKMEESEE